MLLLRFLFHLLHLQKRVAKLKLPGLMDAGLFIESFTVGIDGACSAADLFCTLTVIQPAGKCFTYLKLFGAQLSIALQKSFIVRQIDFLFSQMRQTADLGKGIVELSLHVLCLTAHIFYLSLQVLPFH